VSRVCGGYAAESPPLSLLRITKFGSNSERKISEIRPTRGAHSEDTTGWDVLKSCTLYFESTSREVQRTDDMPAIIDASKGGKWNLKKQIFVDAVMSKVLHDLTLSLNETRESHECVGIFLVQLA